LLLTPGEARDRLTAALYISPDPEDVTGCLEVAMDLAIAAEPIEKSLRERDLRQPFDLDYPTWVTKLVASGELSEADGDDFPGDFLQSAQGVFSEKERFVAAS